VNPKFNLSYQATGDLLFYGTVAKGFRPGGGNEPIPVTPTTTEGAACLASLTAIGKTQAPLAYNPDSVWSYEVGEKAALFDKRLTLNTSAYYEDWSGIQQSVALSCGFVYTDNIADAKIYGLELETHALLAKGLVWSGSASYTDAALSENVPATGAHKGDPLQAIAPWTASSSLSYSVPVPIAPDWKATGRVSFDYVGPRIDATYYPMNHLAAYTIVKLRAGVEDDRWGVFLFVNNLTNTRAMLSDIPSLSINLPTYNRVATNQPLTIGIDLSHKFN
jgi:outer membrane receptor protein involved in Fe transport